MHDALLMESLALQALVLRRLETLILGGNPQLHGRLSILSNLTKLQELSLPDSLTAFWVSIGSIKKSGTRAHRVPPSFPVACG